MQKDNETIFSIIIWCLIVLIVVAIITTLLYFTKIPIWYGEFNTFIYIRYFGFNPPSYEKMVDNIAKKYGSSVKNYYVNDGADIIPDCLNFHAYFPLTRQDVHYNLTYTLGKENKNKEKINNIIEGVNDSVEFSKIMLNWCLNG